ncbi:DUF6221 family protein [Streptosporangium sp. NPDC051023]|uniref:DUF6221 family protein n=1 Tax=Streptosporangium sp. NPDC051023 TaxID=3155410 RepID=UPI0034503870
MEQHPIVAFLRARYVEEEKTIRSLDEIDGNEVVGIEVFTEKDYPCQQVLAIGQKRALAELKVKRKLLDDLVPNVEYMDGVIEGEWSTPSNVADQLLKLLALPYFDHPEYATLVDQAAT